MDSSRPKRRRVPRAAKPYHDWGIRDYCPYLGFQVGLANPHKLKEKRHYDIIFTAKKGDAPKSGLVLMAQEVFRGYRVHYCYDTLSDSWNRTLLGPRRGAQLPGCRLWRNGWSSQDCAS